LNRHQTHKKIKKNKKHAKEIKYQALYATNQKQKAQDTERLNKAKQKKTKDRELF